MTLTSASPIASSSGSDRGGSTSREIQTPGGSRAKTGKLPGTVKYRPSAVELLIEADLTEAEQPLPTKPYLKLSNVTDSMIRLLLKEMTRSEI